MASKSNKRKSSTEQQKDLLSRLQSQLDVEQKSNRQLRREKAVEVQQVREQEQGRAAVAHRELVSKLHQEKQREVEAQRELLRCRNEADIAKVIKQKDQEIKKLQKDLVRCQDELKEEVTKRGLSTSARGAFETERARLLQEIKELSASKKHLEDALRAASEADKVRNIEMRQVQENCKLEVARVEKEAGMEVRKLLEELKAKDHQLALTDRNQYPDKGSTLKQQLENQSVDELLSLSKQIESWEAKLSAKTTTPSQTMTSSSPTAGLQNISWQKKIYELEKQIKLASGLNHAFVEKNKEVANVNNSLETKIKNLTEHNKELNSELTTAKVEINQLNEVLAANNLDKITSQLEKLKRQIKEQEQVIANLKSECQEKDRQIHLKIISQKAIEKKRRHHPKAVRFMLPGETVPTIPGYDSDDADDNVDSLSVDSDIVCQSSLPSSSSSSSSEANLTDDDSEPILSMENIEKDYEQLMVEHLALEKSYASLLQSQSVQKEGNVPPEEWFIEKESLHLAIFALEQKLRRFEENEEMLRIKLEQLNEEKEELEFKVFEQEECAEKNNSISEDEIFDEELMERNKQLESELSLLRKRLERLEEGRDPSVDVVGLRCDRLSPLEITTHGVELNGREEEEAVTQVEITTSTPSPSGVDPRSADDSGCEMVESFSTVTSGFDEAELEEEKESRKEEMEKMAERFREGESTWRVATGRLERQLQDSFLRERRTSDQMVLLEEEKNRRIKALQGQIEILEENETKLTEAIRSMEDLALRTEEDPECSVESDRHAENQDRIPAEEGFSVCCLDDSDVESILRQLEEVEEFRGRWKNWKEIPAEEEDDAAAKLHGKDVEELLKDAEATLRSAVMKMESLIGRSKSEVGTETTSSSVEGRIRALEVELSKKWKQDQSERLLLDLKRSIRTPKRSNADGSADAPESALLSACSAEELQSDIRELRGLLIKLKAVIDHDGEIRTDAATGGFGADADLASVSGESKDDGRKQRDGLNLRLNTSVATSDDWLSPLSPKVFGQLVRSNYGQDLTEYNLHQQVYELAKERDELQKLQGDQEEVIRELHFQNLELQESEKSLRNLVERLERVEEELRERTEEMVEETDGLQALLKELEGRERTLRTQLLRREENEAELAEKLEQTTEELRTAKRKLERRISELESERKSVAKKTEDQADRIGDLEGLTDVLKQKIRNSETLETSLRNQMKELESELETSSGHLSEAEKQKDGLIHRLETAEHERSNLHYEVEDLVTDCNKQCHRISLLNQEIGRLRDALEAKADAISALEQRLEDGTLEREGLTTRLKDCEERESILLERTAYLEASVATKRKELEEELREINGKKELLDQKEGPCHQQTQTHRHPISARIVIPRATSAFREALRSLSERHPDVIHHEVFKTVLLSLIRSSQTTVTRVDPATPNNDDDEEEAMKRFISSLKVDISSQSKMASTNSNGDDRDRRPMKETRKKTPSETGHDDGYGTYSHPSPGSGQSENDKALEVSWKGEEEFWSTVEDPRVHYDVRTSEKSSFWRDIENAMGLIHDDDLTLTIEFRDADVDADQSRSHQDIVDRKNRLHHLDVPPPPLPTSSPPPLSLDDAESADEASDIDDEDDGAVPSCKVDSTPYGAATDRVRFQTDRSFSAGLVRPVPLVTVSADGRSARAKSVDRESDLSEKSSDRNACLGSSHAAVVVGGSLESIPDSGLESMKQGTGAREKRTTTLGKWETSAQFTTRLQILDQSTQKNVVQRTTENVDKSEERSDAFIVLRTQLEQRERELLAKSNEMDRLTQEMRRWQQDAVAAGEEKARLGALLGSALKDLKSSRNVATPGEKQIHLDNGSGIYKSPTRSSFGGVSTLPIWGTSACDRSRQHPSQIPVSLSRHSSAGDKDFVRRFSTSNSPIFRRPTSSLYSSSGSSTDGGALIGSDPGSSLAAANSPSLDRKTPSNLPRPVRDYSPNYLPPGVICARKEADRLFKQSGYDSPTRSSSRQSVTSSSSPLPPMMMTRSTSSSAADDVPSVPQAVDEATSRPKEGAIVV